MFNLLKLKILSDIISNSLLALALALISFWQSISGTLYALLGGGIFFALLSRSLTGRQNIKENHSTIVKLLSKCRSLPFYFVLLIILNNIAFHLYPTWWSGIESLSWPSTNGIIVDTKLLQKPTKGEGSLWQPLVAYKYSIDGHTYHGNTLSFKYFIFGKSWAKQQIQNFEPGNTVAIYYKPSKPEESCLRPGPDKSGTIYAVLILPMILLVLYQLIRIFRSKPQNQSFESDG